MANPYTSEFYRKSRIGSRNAAEAVVPIVMNLINPQSVVDVGCGEGEWLACFSAHGCPRVHGIDGDYISRNSLSIPMELFQAADLEALLTSLDFPKVSFDLAICLEVGEHLPKQLSKRLVEYLTSLAPIVLFSAAVPRQGGPGHINCQWPSFWFDLFESQGFVAFDPIRKHIWLDRQIPYWYAQNIFLMCSKKDRNKFHKLVKETPFDVHNHLTLLNAGIAWREPTLRDIPGIVMGVLQRSLKHWTDLATGKINASPGGSDATKHSE